MVSREGNCEVRVVRIDLVAGHILMDSRTACWFCDRITLLGEIKSQMKSSHGKDKVHLVTIFTITFIPVRVVIVLAIYRRYWYWSLLLPSGLLRPF